MSEEEKVEDKATKKETVGIDYELEYFRLKDVERENNELKETIINLTKIFLNRDKELIKTIQDINKNLRILARRK